MPKPYPSSLTDSEWELVAPFVAPARIARPRKYAERALVDAILYVLRSGCSWRMLPSDFPPWETVYHHFRRWAGQGVFATLSDSLLPKVRQKGGLTKLQEQFFSTPAPASQPAEAMP